MPLSTQPLSVCVAVHGLIEPGTALRRDGARVGDEVWISGTPGDAAGALVQMIQLQRQFEMQVKVIRSGDEMAQSSNQLLRLGG